MSTPTYLDKTGVRVACVTTKKGIHIGCAHVSPPRQLSYDESQIQAVLLSSGRKTLSLGAWALIGLTGAVCLAWISI